MPVAKRVRTLRESKGLSLRALAEACSVSPSTLSQIEQGDTSPSVATLEKLAHGLRIPMAAFFADGDEQQAVEVLNLADCPTFTLRGNAELVPLAAQRHNSSFEPVIVRLEPDGMLAEQPFLVAMESEFVWVRSGSAVLHYDGEEITVREAQAVYYDPRRNHNWRNPHDVPCELLLVRQR
ncbi:MAG: helix-turn-helix domain-containing protein [Gammaproteobacteria bacterium]|nr:helix-turn-helix domain-containing protein [Gammaproteobacteria bacterium]